MERRKATIHTLGCRLNNSESAIIGRKLEAAGYDLVPFGDSADLAIINTCTVTANADTKCRNVIRSFIRKNPQAYTAVVGCYSQMGYKALSEIEGVDLIVGNQEKLNVLDYVSLGKNEDALVIRDRIQRDDFEISFVEEDFVDRRANLKIQDGCSFVCSFCIIPQARGPAKSRRFENLMDEAKALVKAGAKELILTGVNIGTYKDNGRSILHVVEALNEIPGLERLRISSIEPTTIPLELLTLMQDPEHSLVPYLHIPLQSGCDRILKAMKRTYLRDEFSEFILQANELVDDLCIGTDIMVGFPGETDQDFEDTVEFFVENPFSYSHVFSYSRRDKTPAARAEEQVSEDVKKSRSSQLRALSARQMKAFQSRFLGTERTVLFESQKEGYWSGYTDNYVRVLVSSNEDLKNQSRLVRLKESSADFVLGELLSN